MVPVTSLLTILVQSSGKDPPYSVLPVKIVLVHQYLRLGIGVLVINIGAKFIYISFNIAKSKGQDAILHQKF